MSIFSSNAKRTPRSGYSLLEVLLALALSVVVFAAIAMGIQTHLSGLTRQKVMIERKQIARAVLAMMANDLRSGIQYKAADYSGLENLAKTQQMMTNGMLDMMSDPTAGTADPADGGGTSAGAAGATGSPSAGAANGGANAGGGNTGGATSSGSTSSASSGSTSEEESDVMNEEEVSFRPAMLGNESVVMIDISRLPRLDQYNPLIASSQTLAQSPSDVKSVAYFFSDSAGGAQPALEFETAAPGGLYRRDIDRAVAAYMGEVDLLSNPDNFTQLVASEVAEVRFRYFDGSDWQTTWDSADSGGFPMAIEISLIIDPARSSTNNTTYSYSGFDRNTMEQFRTVVHIPVSEPIEE